MDTSQIFEAMGLGLKVWLFTYGMNRIWLWIKGVVS